MLEENTCENVCFWVELTESRWAEVASKHRSLLSCISLQISHTSHASNLTQDRSLEATSLCEQVSEGVVSLIPEFKGQRIQREGEKDQLCKVLSCKESEKVHEKPHWNAICKMQQGSFQTQHGRYIGLTTESHRPYSSSFYSLWPINSYKRASVWLLGSTVFTLTHKHTTHSKRTSRWRRAICKPATQFDFCHSSRTLYGLFCSLSLFQTVMSKLDFHYLTFTYLSTPAYYLSQFSQALNYSLLASASRCLPLTNPLQWTSEFLLVFAALCQSLQTPLICVRVPGGCWINRMPTWWVRPRW